MQSLLRGELSGSKSDEVKDLLWQVSVGLGGGGTALSMVLLALALSDPKLWRTTTLGAIVVWVMVTVCAVCALLGFAVFYPILGELMGRKYPRFFYWFEGFLLLLACLGLGLFITFLEPIKYIVSDPVACAFLTIFLTIYIAGGIIVLLVFRQLQKAGIRIVAVRTDR